MEYVYFTTQRWIIETLFGWRGDEVEKRKIAASYDADNTSIVVVSNKDVGWLTVVHDVDRINLGAIYILPEMQRFGIGTRIIQNLIEDANARDLPIYLSTARINPALELYERLGFSSIASDEYKVYMALRTA